ncbi:hypothetical protein DXG03_003691 [Asterophora parasitica]|uniref:RING-type domain-containing protein n=1 Tax=Asterophora parasitica TaxID=117018 RepID=A0A9P7GCW1_9AGAR|nr:hypothetical protein DXG03_003691 [Asterophora parasitica]
MSFATWYPTQFAAWTRNRNLQPRLTPNPANTPPAGNANDGNASASAAGAKDKDKKTHDSLFGPNIGVVSSGPAWTAVSEKKVLTDELTPEIVSSWIAKSKDASQPTTTLQALVNLKRPTIRLSPLASEDAVSPGAADAHHHHGLEFEYDCDAPKCGIYVHVLLPKDHPDATATVSGSGLSKHLVFESVVEGGFEKLLKLEEGALLELGRFEHIPSAAAAAAAATATPTVEASSTPDVSAPAPDASSNSNFPTTRNRRRFTHLHFRRRSHRSVSGPALAVVDAEPTPAPADAAPNAKGKEEPGADEGVKVTIRLAALDEQGTELASPNEQVTYLHIVRLGAKPEGQADTEEDTRPWVVKVVKREATIGPHTFHLHEIYGLASSSSHVQTPAPTAVLDTQNHTYPPTATSVEPTGAEDDPSSECLLCLSSPREVVLLPCRHLVACKDCALNMVEFGAGGNITQAEEPVPTPAATADAGAEVQAPVDAAGNGAADAAAPAAAAAATPTTNTNGNTRRKRKAKGWFCPVCRQPYTSLLRITTSPPPAPEEQSESKETADEPTPAAEAESNARGILGGGFLRGLSFGRAPPNDVESQAGTGRVGS